MKIKYIIAFLASLLFGLIPISTYFIIFNDGLSKTHSNWGEFGAFCGGVLGPTVGVLAFIGLLWNLDITKRQFKRQSEDSTFFNLIGLHNNKVKAITFEVLRAKKITGFEAFKKYVEKFNYLYDIDSIRAARVEISNNPRKLTYNAYNFLWGKLSKHIHADEMYYAGEKEKKDKIISFFENSSDSWERQKCLIGTDDAIQKEDKEKLISIGHVLIEDSEPEFRVQIIKYVNELFYHDYGHMLGHYFRNIHYILKFIDESEKAIEYSKLFRAQLSRYELTALYYNSLSELSSIEFIKFLIKYDILNGIYWSDICYSPDKEKRSHDMSYILQEKLTRRST